MERLTIKNIENQNRAACRFENCGTDEEYCPLCVQDDDDCELMQVLTDKLAKFEDLEEAERLIILPCKVGDKVKATVLRPYNGHTATIHGEVVGVSIIDKITIRVSYDSCRTIDFLDTDFGDTVFVEART